MLEERYLPCGILDLGKEYVSRPFAQSGLPLSKEGFSGHILTSLKPPPSAAFTMNVYNETG